MAMDGRYTIEELCELTGFSRRTIRYYVQEGLIDPPAGRGRGGFYYDSHLGRLRQIRALQEQGMSLSVIRGHLQGGQAARVPSMQRDVWVRYEIAPGVEVNVRRDVEDRLGRNIAEIIRMARILAKEESDHE
jgi:DNA-binding transcriptional MerR regulator